jgi:hypothetical protein
MIPCRFKNHSRVLATVAEGIAKLERIAKELTTKVKAELVARDLGRVRRAYATRLGQLKAADQAGDGANGHGPGAAPNHAVSNP